MRCVAVTPLLDFPNGVQNHRPSDVGQLQPTHIREDVFFQPTQPLGGVLFTPARLFDAMVLTGYRFERAFPCHRAGNLGHMFDDPGVKATSQLGLGLVPALSGLRQSDGRIDPKCRRLLLAAEPVGHPPILACGLDVKVQATAITVFVACGLARVFGLFDEGIGKWHCWYLGLLVRQIPTKIPRKCWYVHRPNETTLDNKKPAMLENMRVSR